MKKAKKIIMAVMIGSVLMASAGCYGSFSVTKKVYQWNGKVTNDKWSNSILFFGLAVFQVYSFTLFVDAVVLNTVEFWTGDNPLTMNEGDTDTQMVKSGKNTYQVTASKNKFNISQTDGDQAGKSVELIYHEDETAWYATDGTENIKIAQGDLNNQEWVKLFYPNGKVEEIAMK
jgi:hypothetical protein